MDELLKDFLVETGEHVEAVTSQLVRFERDPGDTRIIANIYRLVHTIKGTCGFLDLPRLEALAHAAETLIGRLRDGAPPTPDAVSLILQAIDRIKHIMAGIEASAAEPQGDDSALIAELVSRASGVSLRKPDNDVWDATANEDLSPGSLTPAPGLPGLPERRTETVRVSVGTLERMMALVSELVLARNQLIDRARHIDDDDLAAPLQRLSSVTTDLQHGIMKARMQPIGRLFASLPRTVRDLAAEIGKKVEIVTSGGDTELDRQLVAVVRDPLTHMIRNAIDHGIEMPQARLATGKRETGLISVRAYQEAGHIAIEVSDDGRGLDVPTIRAKAAARGLAKEAEIACLSDVEVCRFVFAPGFSTAASVTSLSGRGIGMDVVRENVEGIGGSVDLSTIAGAGTTFVLKIPLTLAIAPALIVQIAGERYALPEDSIIEVHELGPETGQAVESVNGATVLATQHGVIPVSDLRDLLDAPPRPDPEAPSFAVVLRVAQTCFGIIVDDISEVAEIVVKPLPDIVAGHALYSGNTIMGDGAVVLILDPLGLAAGLGIAKVDSFRIAALAPPIPAEELTPLILFRMGPGAARVLPLSQIQRIDCIRPGEVEILDGGPVARANGRLLPLIGRDGDRIIDAGQPMRPVLVIGETPQCAGLVIDEVIDIFEDRLDIGMAGRAGGTLGTALLRDMPVEVVDTGYFLRRARPVHEGPRAPDGGPRILLVDDSEFFRNLLAAVLMTAGYAVTLADSGEAALAHMETGAAFEAFLIDLDMPHMSGAELARHLAAPGAGARVPMIALAALATPEVLARAAEAGMDTAAGKFDRAALLRLLAGCCARPAGRKEAA